ALLATEAESAERELRRLVPSRVLEYARARGLYGKGSSTAGTGRALARRVHSLRKSPNRRNDHAAEGLCPALFVRPPHQHRGVPASRRRRALRRASDARARAERCARL